GSREHVRDARRVSGGRSGRGPHPHAAGTTGNGAGMTIGIGVLGSGFMGHTWAEVAANHAQGTQLVAVAGGRRAAGLAQEYGIPEEPSFEALLERGDVDAVAITTPPDGHRDQVVQAAKAGKHILVEKPMAITAAEARDMVAAAD